MEIEGCRVCRCLKIPGMCFDPSDEKLVAYYLKEKIEGRPLQCNHLMTELQIYHDDFMPWEIIKDDNPYWITSSCDSSNNNKIKKTIFVFTELRKRISRVIRRSGRGSWTGQNNPVVKNRAGDDIGYNKLLTFYQDNDDKKGKKKKKIPDDDQEHGHWIMHEYSLFGIDKYVLCKIIKEVRISAKTSVSCPTKAAAATQDFRTQGDAHIMNVVSEDQERQSGDCDQILDESTADWDKNGWMEELYQEFGMSISDVQELPAHSQPITFDCQEDNNMICNNHIPDFLVQEEAIAVVNQPSDILVQDFRTQGDAHIMNVVSEDQERQSGDGDQILDESAADWDKNGWMEELYQELGMNIFNVQDLPVHSQPITFDGQDMICNNQIPDFMVQEEAIAVVNQPSDYSGADLDANGQNSVLYERYGTADDLNQTGIPYGTSAGVGVVKELPIVAVMDNPKQGQVILDNLLEETVAVVQEIPVAVLGKNGQRDGSYKSLDGAGNHDIIILDDDSNGVYEGQESMMIEAADAPQIQVMNVDNQADNDMDGNKQILDDFWNGLDVFLDFSSPDLLDLWPDEFNEQSCSILEGQPGKRMMYGEEDCEERPSGKKQRCF